MGKLVSHADPVLHQRAKRVHVFGPHWRPLLDDMYITMKKNNGIGLAAPQIGVAKAVAIIQIAEGQPLYEMFNPKLLEATGRKERGLEGCLSLPGVVVPKHRFTALTIQYQDMYGQTQTLVATGLLAAAVQHEMDHLNGRLITHGVDYV